MSEILLSNHGLSPQNFEDQCGYSIGEISSLGCITPAMVSPNRPYLLKESNSANDENILAQLSSLPPNNELANLALSFGGDNVVALADATSKLSDFGNTLTGASTSIYVNRVTKFTTAANNYQSALMAYRQDMKLNTALKTASRQKAYVAFNEMQANLNMS